MVPAIMSIRSATKPFPNPPLVNSTWGLEVTPLNFDRK